MRKYRIPEVGLSARCIGNLYKFDLFEISDGHSTRFVFFELTSSQETIYFENGWPIDTLRQWRGASSELVAEAVRIIDGLT